MAYTNATFFLDLESGSDTARTALTSVTVANNGSGLVRCTKTAHGLVTGAVGTASLNYAGDWKIMVIDANTFDLIGSAYATSTALTFTPFGGSSKADAWRTFSSGATAARIAPGDTIRVMASPDETLVGDAAWTQYSKTVTLAASVTQTISDCETLWTGAANTTISNSTANFKEGSKSTAVVFASAFTTGKAAYFSTGTLDLSAYQQVSFWLRANTAFTTGTLSLRLCSDTAGATTVHTIPIPTLPASSSWIPVVVNLGVALDTAIASVALYCDADPGTATVWIDNINACKASSAADALTLHSLIGKAWNAPWAATTVYALNDKRRPTQPMRNGIQYKVSVAGTSAAAEPAWPFELGATVVDGSVTWVAQELEDSWYAIQSINGTTVKIDNQLETIGSAGRGYAGATETVATYKRSVIISTGSNTIVDSGTGAAPIVFSGGWDRAAMTAQSGETWFSGHSVVSGGAGCHPGSNTYIDIYNINLVRFDRGGIGTGGATGLGIRLFNCHWNNNGAAGYNATGALMLTAFGCAFRNNGLISTNGTFDSTGSGSPLRLTFTRVAMDNNLVTPWRSGAILTLNTVHCRNNTGYGASIGSATRSYGLVTANNSSGGVEVISINQVLVNSLIGEATVFSSLGTTPLSGTDAVVYSQRHNQVADAHLITFDGGTIISATDQRHTAFGISWKFRPTSTIRGTSYPLRLSVAKIACAANVAVSVTIWTRRDSTNIVGGLKLAGGQLGGLPVDIVVACAPTINTWEQSTALTFTPTEAGVVEITFEVYDGIGTANNFWLDDLVIT